MTPITTILVPIDFSDASKEALRYACRLADAFDASLHVLHAVENPYLPGGYLEFYAPSAQFFEQIDQDVQRNLDEALTEAAKVRYHAVLVRTAGVPAQAILGYLHEHPEIDLVVMATQGRGGVARLMLGSVADKVIRAAPCPVLTLRPATPASDDVTRAA